MTEYLGDIIIFEVPRGVTRPSQFLSWARFADWIFFDPDNTLGLDCGCCGGRWDREEIFYTRKNLHIRLQHLIARQTKFESKFQIANNPRGGGASSKNPFYKPLVVYEYTPPQDDTDDTDEWKCVFSVNPNTNTTESLQPIIRQIHDSHKEKYRREMEDDDFPPFDPKNYRRPFNEEKYTQ